MKNHELEKIKREKLKRLLRRDLEETRSEQDIIVGTDSNFSSILTNSDLPVVVDFWAEWCVPCRIIEPIFREVAVKYRGKAKFVRINVDQNLVVPREHEVLGIPTIIVFQNGREKERIVGVVSARRLEQAIIPYIT